MGQYDDFAGPAVTLVDLVAGRWSWNVDHCACCRALVNDHAASFLRWAQLETVAVVILSAAIGAIAYGPFAGNDPTSGNLDDLLQHRQMLAFLILVPLMWAGLRGNQRNVAMVALVFCGTVAWGLSSDSGPLSKMPLASLIAIILCFR